MSKLEQVIEAMSSLPEAERDDLADHILELAAAMSGRPNAAPLTPDQLAELDRRLATGFRPGAMSRIDELFARLS